MAEPVEIKKKRDRSPNYPGLALDSAIEKARLVHSAAKHHPITADSLHTAMGYKPKTGPAMVASAAMKAFGLLEETPSSNKTKMFKLTSAAQRIVVDTNDASPERIAAIKKAALSPKLYSDLWNKYGTILPADDVIQVYLRLDLHFTEGAAIDAIRKYKRTLEFAKLEAGDTSSTPDGTSPPNDPFAEPIDNELTALAVAVPSTPRPLTPGTVGGSQPFQAKLPPLAPGMREISLPASGGYALFRAPYPLTKAVFDRLMKTLKDYEGEFVKDEKQEDNT